MKIIHQAVPEEDENKVFQNGRLYVYRNSHADNVDHSIIFLMTPAGLVTLPAGSAVLNTDHHVPSKFVDVTDDYTLVHSSIIKEWKK